MGPNGEKRKQITMLLSDPETDEYIQQKLDLPVMRFQVQSNVAFDAISTEWTKVAFSANLIYSIQFNFFATKFFARFTCPRKCKKSGNSRITTS